MTAAGHHYRPELQAVRGIAALAVLVYHCLIFYRVGPHLSWWTEVILNPHAQVVLFFVMSSLVLSGSLSGKPAGLTAYMSFLLRRAARIYPALWLSVGLACLYLALRVHLPAAPDRSPWISAIDTHRMTLSEILGSLIGARDVLVPPLWSIKVELLASLAVPGFAWLAVSGRRGRWLLYAIAAVLAAYSMRASLNEQYLVDFAFGAIASSWIAGSSAVTRRSSALTKFICTTLVLAMLLFRNLDSQWRFGIFYHAPLPALVEGVFAASFLVVLETSDLTGSMLLAPALVWLGDISYSIYLLHFPVMELSSRLLALALGHYDALHPDIEAAALMITTLGVVIPLSHLCYRHVEIRGIAVGARLRLAAVRLPLLAGRQIVPSRVRSGGVLVVHSEMRGQPDPGMPHLDQ
jgi:peptidoglycan/LPS O-acetylase OafA/YrhL